jgi:beta-N-acetylhexosaminidase
MLLWVLRMEIASWSAEKLAGQRLMAGFEGTRLNAVLKRLILDQRVGGLILFKRNVESPAQLRELCRSAQAFAQDTGQPPLFIAIDQEGGRVARLGPPFTQFPKTPPAANAEEAARFAAVSAAELTFAGINMNLVPVLDVAPEGFASIMAGRSFGPDPEHVARLGAVIINGLQSRRILAVAKHFPGIGRTTLDSHLDLPVMDADLPSFERCDWIPFRAAIAAGVAGVMLSHVVYQRLDPDWPASLSLRIVRGLLRNRLGFNGITLTDDLEMGAIRRRCALKTAVRQALRADVDQVLICHSAEKIAQAHALMTRKIGESERKRHRSERSAYRVLALKTDFLLDSAQPRPRENTSSSIRPR